MDLIPSMSSLRGIGRQIETLADKAGDVVSKPVEAVGDLGRDVYEGAKSVASKAWAPTSAFEHIGKVWTLIGQALKTGKNVQIPGNMPPYPTLEPAQMAKALQAGQGRTIDQPLLASDKAGTHVHDPVNLVVHGSREDLVKALESQGWVQAAPLGFKGNTKLLVSALFGIGNSDDGPVSKQYLNGRVEDMAFNKNSDHSLGRDHFRVYHQGKDANGQDVWAIAAIRDLSVSLTVPHPERNGSWLPWKWDVEKPRFTHRPDVNIDGERDLVMDDLLKSQQVADWAAIDGRLPKGHSKDSTGPGRYELINRYPSDGKVYEVTLK